MAVTAANFTVIESGVVGDLRCVIATMTGDSSYATGGSTITPAMLGFSTGILSFVVSGAGSSLGSRLAAPLKQSDGSFKLKLYTAITPTEMTNATNDSTSSYHILAFGR